MTTCAVLLGSWGDPMSIQAESVPPPPDFAVCEIIWMSGNDFASLRALHTAQGAATIPDIIPYDYQAGAAFWAYGFTSLLVLYAISHAIGLVIKSIRDF